MTLADIRVGLRAYLLADAAIFARVGQRVFPNVMPQGTKLDSIVYRRISGLGDHHSEGPSGLSRPRIQIDCWSERAFDAGTLALLVKERIDGFRGAMLWGDNSPGEAIQVQGIFFESERDDYDDAVKMHRTSQDYFAWYEER